MSPSDAPLTRERILATAEDVVRRFGPDKATVVDVARALGELTRVLTDRFDAEAEAAAVLGQRVAALSAQVEQLQDELHARP